MFEILTPNGFKPFKGIKAKESSTILITTENNEIEVTHSHLIKNGNGKFVEASTLKIGDILLYNNQPSKITQIKECGKNYVYDAVEVEGGHEYITNGFVSHNCSFIGSADTLLNMNKLAELKFPTKLNEPFFGNDIRVYKAPEPGHTYIMTADGAKGSIDAFAIGVFDVTSLPFEQVVAGQVTGSYLNAPPVFYNILKSYNTAYFICENNEGAGTSVLDILSIQYNYTNIYQEEGKKWLGHRTTVGNRSRMLSALKLFFENNKLIINDKKTVSELMTFVNKNGKYQADSGCHDDLVITLALFVVPFLDIENINDYEGFVKTLNEEQLVDDFYKYSKLAFIDDGPGNMYDGNYYKLFSIDD